MSISLSKGQRISLDKSVSPGLNHIVMGLSWDARTVRETRKVGGFLGFGSHIEVTESKQSIDLDASCVMFDRTGQHVDSVWFRQLQSKCGGLKHTGDNRTGDGDGDDEQILVDLSRVSVQVQHLVFVVNSFSGESFAEIENAVCRLVNSSTNQEIARYSLGGGGNHTAQVMARVSRDSNGWSMTAIGVPCHGRTFADLMPAIKPQLN